MKMYYALAPFQGFNNTIHSHNIDEMLKSWISRVENEETQDLLRDILHYGFDYTSAFKTYGKQYIAAINREYALNIEFEIVKLSKDSFLSNDDIYIKVSESDLIKIVAGIEVTRLQKSNQTDLAELVIAIRKDDCIDWDQFDPVDIEALIRGYIETNDFAEWESYIWTDVHGEDLEIIKSGFSKQNLKKFWALIRYDFKRHGIHKLSSKQATN